MIDAIIDPSLSMTKPVQSSSLVYSILFCYCKGTPTKSVFFFDGNEVFLHPSDERVIQEDDHIGATRLVGA